MLGDYNLYLNRVNDDIAQWDDVYKTANKRNDHGVFVDDTKNPMEPRIKKVFLSQLNLEDKHPQPLDNQKIGLWAINHLSKSKEDAFRLANEAIKSNDLTTLKTALTSISRLNQTIYQSRHVFDEMLRQEAKGTERYQLLEAVYENIREQSSGLEDAKKKLGERIQKVTNPPPKYNLIQQTFARASTLLNKKETRVPPTAQRPYWIDSRDGTETAKKWINFIFTELQPDYIPDGYPRQLPQDVKRQNNYIKGSLVDMSEIRNRNAAGKIDSNESGVLQAEVLFNQFLSLAGNDRLLAFRLASIYNQHIIPDLVALAMQKGEELFPEDPLRYAPGSGASYLNLQIEGNAVIFSYKTLYSFADSRDENLDPGVLLIKKEVRLPLDELKKETLEIDALVAKTKGIEFWSSLLATKPYAEEEILNF